MNCLALEPLLEAVADCLRQDARLAGLAIETAFPARRRPAPLKSAALAVGLKNVTMSAGAFGDYLGVFGAEETSGCKQTVTLLLTLYLPYATGGTGLFALYAALADCLMGQKSSFSVSTCTAGEAKLDQENGVYTLDITATVSGYATRAAVYETFDRIDVIRP